MMLVLALLILFASSAYAWNVTVQYDEPAWMMDGERLGAPDAPRLEYTTLWYQRPGKPLKSIKIPASTSSGSQTVTKVLRFTDDTKPCLYKVEFWATATTAPNGKVSIPAGKVTKYYGKGNCLCL